MKYWYLKDGDVLGPLSAQEIAQDSSFAPEILVCPEPNSGDEGFWKTPDMYPQDFAPFVKVAAPAPVVAPSVVEPKTQPAPAQEPKAAPAQTIVTETKVKPAQTLLQPQKKAEAAVVKKQEVPIVKAPILISPEETIHAQAPLLAGETDNLLEDLPAKALLKDEPAEEEKQEEQPQEAPAAEEVKKEEPHPADPLIAAIESQKPLTAFREEDFTFANAKEESKKPSPHAKENTLFRPKQERGATIVIPAGNTKFKADAPQPQELKPAPAKAAPAATAFSAGSRVVHIKQDGEEVLPEPQKKNGQQEKSFFSSMAEEKPSTLHTEDVGMPFAFGGEMKTASVSELIEDEKTAPKQPKAQRPSQALPMEDDEDEPLIPTAAVAAERISGAIMPTTNGKILSSSDGRLDPEKPKNDVIYLLVISMCVFTVIALFITFFGGGKDKAKEGKKLPAVSESAPAPMIEEKVAKAVLQGTSEGVASPEVRMPSKPINMPNAINSQGISSTNGSVSTAADEAQKTTRARQIVERYLLDEKRGTLAEYFAKKYPQEYYQIKWEANNLYGSAYAVYFKAFQVGHEPFTYVFKVDIEKGLLLEGLSSDSIDLLKKKQETL